MTETRNDETWECKQIFNDGNLLLNVGNKACWVSKNVIYIWDPVKRVMETLQMQTRILATFLAPNRANTILVLLENDLQLWDLSAKTQDMAFELKNLEFLNWRGGGIPSFKAQLKEGVLERTASGLFVLPQNLSKTESLLPVSLQNYTDERCSHIVANDKLYSGFDERGYIVVTCLRTGAELITLQKHTRTVICLMLKDNYLFSGSQDGTVCVWDINTHELAKIFIHPYKPRSHGVSCLAINNGKLYAAYGHPICIWDFETQEYFGSVFDPHIIDFNIFMGNFVDRIEVINERIYTSLFFGGPVIESNLIPS